MFACVCFTNNGLRSILLRGEPDFWIFDEGTQKGESNFQRGDILGGNYGPIPS